MRLELSAEDVAAGESWITAAERHAGLLPSPLLAVDLSTDPLVFATDEQHRFGVRRLTDGDLPDLHRWLNAPHVARWWDGRDTLQHVRADFSEATRDRLTRYWIWEVNGRSVGWAQDYRIADHPDYALLCGSPEAIGFDYLIGEPAFVGRGIGTSLLWTYLRDIVAPAYPDADELFAAPDHRNSASLRVLAKLGARQGLWFDEPHGPGEVITVVSCSIDVRRVMATSVTDG